MIWIKWGGIAAAIVTMWFTAFNAGVNSVRSDMLAKLEQSDKEWQSQVTLLEKRRNEALSLVNELQNRPPEVVTNEIIKVVQNSDCKRVSPDVIRLLNGE